VRSLISLFQSFIQHRRKPFCVFIGQILHTFYELFLLFLFQVFFDAGFVFVGLVGFVINFDEFDFWFGWIKRINNPDAAPISPIFQ
jgi:hypothetical protein